MIYRLKYLLVVILLLSGTANAFPQSADNDALFSVSGKLVKTNSFGQDRNSGFPQFTFWHKGKV